MKRKTNVQYLDTQYFLNLVKGTAVCKLEFEIDLNKIPGVENWIENPEVQDFLEENSEWTGCVVDEDDYIVDYGTVLFTVEGKSKATGGDVFDETVGKRVALTRAQAQAFKVATRFYDDIAQIIYDSTVAGLDDLVEGAYRSWDRCMEHADELLTPYFEITKK